MALSKTPGLETKDIFNLANMGVKMNIDIDTLHISYTLEEKVENKKNVIQFLDKKIEDLKKELESNNQHKDIDFLYQRLNKSTLNAFLIHITFTIENLQYLAQNQKDKENLIKESHKKTKEIMEKALTKMQNIIK